MSHRRRALVREILGRSDYTIIGEVVEPGSRVLDLGCGDGELLAWLVENKNVQARGVEIDGAKVQRAISRGVSVYQGDLEQGLEDYPDKAFDYVILSQTLQQILRPLHVLREILRVGDRAMTADHDHGRTIVVLPQASKQIDAAAVRQANIQQEGVHPMCLAARTEVGRGMADSHRVAFALQNELQ